MLVLLTKQTLDFVQIYSTLHESRGERVPPLVETEVWNTCPIARFAKLPNQRVHSQGGPEHGTACGRPSLLGRPQLVYGRIQGIMRRVPFLLFSIISPPRAKSTSCHCRLRISPWRMLLLVGDNPFRKS